MPIDDPVEISDELRVPNLHYWLASAVVAAYLGCVAVAALLATSVRNDTITVHHGGWLRTALSAAAVALFGAAWIWARTSRRTHPPRKRHKERLRRLSQQLVRGTRAAVDPIVDETTAGSDPVLDLDERIRTWVTDFYDRYDERELYKTARIAFLPGRYVHRAVQTVTLNELSTRHKVAREVRIPGKPSNDRCRVIVPVLTLRKESMVDGLDVKCDGASGLTLGYKESQGATLWLAAVLMHRAAVLEEDRRAALHLIASETASNVVPLLRVRPGGSHGPEAQQALLEARSFVAMLITYRIVFVEVGGEPGARVSLKVGWSSNQHDRFNSFADATRAFFGLGPTSIAGEVVGAEAASWHLRVQAPAGTHMKRVSLYVPLDTEPGKAFVLNSNGIAGRELAHVRVRRLSPPEGMRLPAYFRAHLGETPPGIGGPLAILTLALTAMIWGLGVFYDDAFPKTAATASARAVLKHPGGITAAAMLAVISAVSGWLISRFSDEAVRRAQLREVIALMAVMVTSAAAVFSAALRLARIQLVGPTHPDLVGAEITIANTTWFAIMLVSGSLLLMAWGGLIVRIGRLRRMIVRSREHAF